MSPADRSAAGPAAGNTETLATAAAKHSEPAADRSELQSEAGEPTELAETFTAEKEEISQTAAQTAAAEATVAVATSAQTVKTTSTADAAKATDSNETTKDAVSAANKAAAAD